MGVEKLEQVGASYPLVNQHCAGDVVPGSFRNTGGMRDLSEVGRRVSERRTALGFDAAELARQAGVDPKTLASLERGERWPRDHSKTGIERALKWKPGSLTRIRNGGEPQEIDEVSVIRVESAPTTSASVADADVVVILSRVAGGGQVDETTRSDAQRLLDDMHIGHLDEVIDMLSREGKLKVYHFATEVYADERNQPFTLAARREDYPKPHSE